MHCWSMVRRHNGDNRAHLTLIVFESPSPRNCCPYYLVAAMFVAARQIATGVHGAEIVDSFVRGEVSSV